MHEGGGPLDGASSFVVQGAGAKHSAPPAGRPIYKEEIVRNASVRSQRRCARAAAGRAVFRAGRLRAAILRDYPKAERSAAAGRSANRAEPQSARADRHAAPHTPHAAAPKRWARNPVMAERPAPAAVPSVSAGPELGSASGPSSDRHAPRRLSSCPSRNTGCGIAPPPEPASPRRATGTRRSPCTPSGSGDNSGRRTPCRRYFRTRGRRRNRVTRRRPPDRGPA